MAAEKKIEWRDRKIETKRLRVGDVMAHPMNPKIHPDKQLAPLRGLLESVGKLDDLKGYYSERNGGKLTFFDGHGRQSLDPDAEWDVDIYDITDAEADLVVAAFDPIAYQAEMSRVKLDELLREVETGNAALTQMLSDIAAENGLIPGNIELDDVALSDEKDGSSPVGFEERIALVVPPEDYEEARKIILTLLQDHPGWDAKFPT